jgi:N-acetylneuraminic acid mutarotase
MKRSRSHRQRILAGASSVLLTGLTVAIPVAARATTGDGHPSASRGWVSLTPSNIARSEVGTAAVGRSIYVVGGFVGPLGPIGFMTTNQAERYDVDTGHWQFVKPMPLRLNHPSAVAYKGDLYVLGGYTNGFSNPGVPTGGLLDTSDAFLRYHPQTDTWSPMAPMPIARTAAASAVIGDRLYIAGGRNRLPTFVSSDGLLKRLDIFDFTSGAWSRGPDMTIAREHVAGVTAAGAFYAIGGRTPLESTAAVERFLPSERRWERVADMRLPRNGFGAGALDERVVVFGGEEPSTPQFRLKNEGAELFDPTTGHWSDLPDMRTPRAGVGLGAVVGLRVYAIDGLVAAPETTCCSASNMLEALDIGSIVAGAR